MPREVPAADLPRWVSPALRGPWRFAAGDPAGASSPDFGDAGWAEVTVPHCWNVADVAAGRGVREDPRSGYRRGPGWYRLRFDWVAVADRRVFLRFEAASQFAEVFLNGRPVGAHAGAFTAFCCEITAELRAGANLLAVRVDNRWSPDLAPLDGDFAVFGGLYRPVRLIVTGGGACIDPTWHAGPGVEVRPLQVDAARADFEVRVRLDGVSAGGAELRLRVCDANGREVAAAAAALSPGAAVFAQLLTVAEPRRWDGRRDPHLYTAEAALWCAGRCVDRVAVEFGLRSFRFDPAQGFLLNERPCRMRGVSRHQDRAGQGWALSDADHAEDIAHLLDMGANAVRLAHYPHAEALHTRCDRAGLLVWSEIPLVNASSATPGFAESTRRQLLEMIHQQINRAGVFAWGLWNELGMTPGPSPVDLVRELQQVAHETDPSRPTVAAGFDPSLELFPELIPLTDLVGWNQYHGWYQGTPADLGPAVDRLHAVVPDRGLAVSEYGAGANPEHHETAPATGPDPFGDWHPEEWQALVHEGNWAAIAARPWIWGSFVWNLFDFASAWRAEGGYRGLNDKGLVSADRRLRKDAYFFYRALWSDAPTLHLTSRRHTERAASPVPVKVYSNLPAVELRVNGRLVPGGTRDGVIWRWSEVALTLGDNTIEVSGRSAAGDPVYDACRWSLSPVVAPRLSPDASLPV